MKVNLPLLGKASGSYAGMIYQSYWSHTYARSFPFSFHYPDTRSQQICQALFFDLQRYWIPIYNRLKKDIKMQQRRNKNPFNRLSSAIYHIFNPYQEKIKDTLPSNFGLDAKNRVRPVITDYHVDFKEGYFNIAFEMQRPYNDLFIKLDHIHIVLFNNTKQNMMYQQDSFHAETYIVTFQNTLEWKETDEIYCYISLSSLDWLGNFNLIS